jgi:chemotaxis protein MotB
MRLWAYAIVMTLVAAAAGYSAWEQRGRALAASADYAICADGVDPVREQAQLADRRAQACEADLLEVAAQAKANEAQLAKMQGNLSATKEELTALLAQRVEAEKQLAAVAKIREQFARMIDTGQLKVSARRGSMVVELPAEVLFRSASAELSEKGELSVLEVGFILKQFADRRFLVVGHTDSLPLRNAAFRDNWHLSTARALTVTHVLVKAGMKPDSLMAAGAGEHDPVTSNTRASDRQRNRRIEIQLLPALAELPPLPGSIQETPAEAAVAKRG